MSSTSLLCLRCVSVVSSLLASSLIAPSLVSGFPDAVYHQLEGVGVTMQTLTIPLRSRLAVVHRHDAGRDEAARVLTATMNGLRSTDPRRRAMGLLMVESGRAAANVEKMRLSAKGRAAALLNLERAAEQARAADLALAS